jgi:hypothetical protein
MLTFTQRFDAANGGPIEYEGRQLHAAHTLSVAEGDRIALQFLHSIDRPVQGLGVKCEKCEIAVAQAVAKSLALWTDTAPPDVELQIVKAGKGARVTFFNQWRDEKYGTTMYRLNNAAMDIVPQDDGSDVLRCSDGWGEQVDFNDLVVKLTQKRK